MSTLTICNADTGERIEHLTDHGEIGAKLDKLSVQFERWQLDTPLAADAGPDDVLGAYAGAIDKLSNQYGFQSVDVVALEPDHPQKTELRRKYLQEHTHDDYEVRFFVHGDGLFYLHVGDKVMMLMCEKGDLVSVPAGVTHWFDMGAAPDFKCIRFFTTANGWEGNFTGDDFPGRFPDFDQYRSQLG